jgi:hypothetical protein
MGLVSVSTKSAAVQFSGSTHWNVNDQVWVVAARPATAASSYGHGQVPDVSSVERESERRASPRLVARSEARMIAPSTRDRRKRAASDFLIGHRVDIDA